MTPSGHSDGPRESLSGEGAADEFLILVLRGDERASYDDHCRADLVLKVDRRGRVTVYSQRDFPVKVRIFNGDHNTGRLPRVDTLGQEPGGTAIVGDAP